MRARGSSKCAAVNEAYKTVMPNKFFRRAKELGAAIWFYLWCIDRTVVEVTYDDEPGKRYGRVFGTMPVSVADVGQDFPGIGRWALDNWRLTCEAAGLIRTKRAPTGYQIEVIDSEKFPNKEPIRRASWSKSDSRCTTNHSEVIRQNLESDSPKPQITGPVIRQNLESNKREQVFRENRGEVTQTPLSSTLKDQKPAGIRKSNPAGSKSPEGVQKLDDLLDAVSRELVLKNSALYGGHRKSLRQQLAGTDWTEAEVTAATRNLLEGLSDFQLQSASGIVQANLMAKLQVIQTQIVADAKREADSRHVQAYLKEARAKDRAEFERKLAAADAEKAARDRQVDEAMAAGKSILDL